LIFDNSDPEALMTKQIKRIGVLTSPASCTPTLNGIPTLPSTHHTPVILARVRGEDALLGICAGRLPPNVGCVPNGCWRAFYLVGDGSG
jgi:hypothetical protein